MLYAEDDYDQDFHESERLKAREDVGDKREEFSYILTMKSNDRFGCRIGTTIYIALGKDDTCDHSQSIMAYGYMTS